MRATLPRRARSMLPWALDRLVPMLPRVSRRPALAGRFALRPEPLGRPPTRTWGEGRVFRPCPAPCDRRRDAPEGTNCTIAVAPASPERAASAATTSGLDAVASGSSPRGGSTASVSAPEGAGRRRHRDASPKRLVRDPALAPKSGVRWFELVLVILPRSPAYLMPRLLAAHAHARRRARLRATRAQPRRVLRRTPRACSRRSTAWSEPWASPGRADPWRLVAPASPASWRAGSGQTVIVFTGTAETRSEDEVSPPIRRSE
jgi:hypothetical protein